MNMILLISAVHKLRNLVIIDLWLNLPFAKVSQLTIRSPPLSAKMDEEETDEIHRQLIEDASDTSPMNSNFSALACDDTLRLIFQKLPIADLARASCVCRSWNVVASDKEMVTSVFKSPWRLKEVIGTPSSGSFWRDNGIGKFAISHRIVKGDSVTSLAVKYSVQVMDIKRLNNMMSDHGIYSRERLLIPVSSPNVLAGSTCYIELDTHAKREVAVLYPNGRCKEDIGRAMNSDTTNHGKKKILDSLKRSMQVDDGTAQYYLSISNGDPRAALSEFSQDLRWEMQGGRA